MPKEKKWYWWASTHNFLNLIKPQSSKAGTGRRLSKWEGVRGPCSLTLFPLRICIPLELFHLHHYHHHADIRGCCSHLNAPTKGGLTLSTNLTMWKRCCSPVELHETGQLVPYTAQRNMVITPPIHKFSLGRIVAPSKQQNLICSYVHSLLQGVPHLFQAETLLDVLPQRTVRIFPDKSPPLQKTHTCKPFFFRGDPSPNPRSSVVPTP